MTGGREREEGREGGCEELNEEGGVVGGMGRVEGRESGWEGCGWMGERKGRCG